MLKKVLMLSILSLVIGVGSVQAGWVRDGVAQNFMSLNRHVSTRLGVWHWGQPTTYTCGATTISMQMAWESYKKMHNSKTYLRYSPISIYGYINTTGGETSGLTTDEVKAGVKKIVDFINSSRELGINVDLKESKSSTISDAIVSYATWINRNHSPAIMLGNVRDGTPGMHYFLIVGYHGYNNEGYGFYLNDSTYNSPAYPKDSPIGSIAIPPRKFVYRTELERYWAKTGSRFTSLRKHMYLYNSATSP